MLRKTYQILKTRVFFLLTTWHLIYFQHCDIGQNELEIRRIERIKLSSVIHFWASCNEIRCWFKAINRLTVEIDTCWKEQWKVIVRNVANQNCWRSDNQFRAEKNGPTSFNESIALTLHTFSYFNTNLKIFVPSFLFAVDRCNLI